MITGYIVLLFKMKDDAYSEYQALCVLACTLNAPQQGVGGTNQ